MGKKLSILCIFSILLFLNELPLFAQWKEITQTVIRWGKILGPKPFDTPPAWANPDSKPLFCFAWLSDMHLDGANQQAMVKTLQWIDQHLQPTFLLLTGDNSAIVPGGEESADPATRNLRRQQYLQQWLADHWKRPYVIIPGDNWPGGFDQVFGPRQYRIECGGLHLVLLAPDAMYHGPGMEGLSAFDPETLDWLRKDMETYRDHPTLVAIHEPIYPPTFLDAPQLRKIIKEAPQVIGVFQGHLHIDMELQDGKQTYLVAPAVGPGQPPAFKYVLVYPHALILRTAEFQKAKGQWQLVEKWQKIDIPQSLQKVLHPVVSQSTQAAGASATEAQSSAPVHLEKPFRVVSSRPARPVREDPALASRAKELLDTVRQFLWKDAPKILSEIQPQGNVPISPSKLKSLFPTPKIPLPFPPAGF